MRLGCVAKYMEVEMDKQIEELAYLLHKLEYGEFDLDCDGDCHNCWCTTKKIAKALIKAGYRKQSGGIKNERN